jgi:hypothetical protein
MNFRTIEDLKKEGFQGFAKIADLINDQHRIPAEKGVYLVLRLDGDKPAFSVKGSGGFFKGDDPNVSVSELESNWVNGTIVINIGQAGGGGSKATLKSRIKQYLDFGQGKPVGHKGGRLIWQIKNYQDLLLCWKSTGNEDPRMVEKGLIQEFKAIYGKRRPFANLQD